MRVAGKKLARVLDKLKLVVQPNVRLLELEQLAEQLILAEQAQPAFKGYKGYPNVLCTSVNDEVVHCKPTRQRVKNGDIISIDIGLIYQGFYADSAITVPVGNISTEAQRLLTVTSTAVNQQAWAVIKPGNTIGDIGQAVQVYVEQAGFSVVRALVGHGIGRELHEDPAIPNFGQPHTGATLKPGMTLAIEPMVNIGKAAVVFKEDGWRVVTKDHSLSAHFEHTFLVTETGCEVLTSL